MMTYYIFQFQAAIHGDAEVLRSLDVQPIMKQIRNEECDWVRDSQLENGRRCWAEAQTKLPESGTVVMLLNFTDGTIVDLFCLNKIMKDHPELQCAAFAKIQWEAEEPYSEYYTYCSEEPGDGVCCGSEFTDGMSLTPSVLELTGHTGKRHAFSFHEFAEALRKNTPDLAEKLNFPPEKLEDHLECLTEGEPVAFHVCLSPEGKLSLGAYEAMQDPKSARVLDAFERGKAERDELLAVYREVFQNDGLQFREEGEGRHCRWFVLDEDGNEYFLHSQWRLRTARSDWSFPEGWWDWAPFDWKEYFPLPNPFDEDEDWCGDDEEDFDEEDE